MKHGHGLVIGKFYPLHAGHIQLLYFARASCHKLTVVVYSRPCEVIPGAIRYGWVKEILPDANVVHSHNPDDFPQVPEDHPDAWNIWIKDIVDRVPEPFDAVFASEDYGFELATRLNAVYIPFNRERNIIPVSGTQIRGAPMANWPYIPVVARPYFVKRIAILGATSSGKSTTAKKLAEKFMTVHVEEYARTYIEEQTRANRRTPKEWFKEDLPIFAQGQTALETTKAYLSNRFLFCDTDVLTTCTWWKFLFEDPLPRWMETEMLTKEYDMTYILQPIPFTQDGTRSMVEDFARNRFYDLLLKNIDRTARKYRILEPASLESRIDIIATEIACSVDTQRKVA